MLFAQRVSRVLKNKHWNPTGIVKILSRTYLSYYVIVRLIIIFLNYIGVVKVSISIVQLLTKRITQKCTFLDYKGRSSTWNPFFSCIHEKYEFAQSNRREG